MYYHWNLDKNELLKQERGISFEEIVFHLSVGDLWKISEHPNQERYPGQSIYYVIVNDYIYLVPHVMTAEGVFLKTIIPSRKASKDFLHLTGDL